MTNVIAMRPRTPVAVMMFTRTPTLMTVASNGKTCSEVFVRTSHQRRSPFRCGAAKIATIVLMRKISGMPRIGARNAAYFDSSSRTTKVSSGAEIRSQFIPSGAFGSDAMTVSLLSGLPPRSR